MVLELVKGHLTNLNTSDAKILFKRPPLPAQEDDQDNSPNYISLIFHLIFLLISSLNTQKN